MRGQYYPQPDQLTEMAGDVLCGPQYTRRSLDKGEEDLATVLAFLDDVFTQVGGSSLSDCLDQRLHDDDNECDGSEKAKATPSGSDSEGSSTSAPSRATRTDQRQREELRAIRDEIAVLEGQLEQLKQRFRQFRERRSTTYSSGASDRGDLKLTNLRSYSWQIITAVQRRRREASEHERERLRHQIKEQKLLLRSIRRFLARHTTKTVHAAFALHQLSSEHPSELKEHGYD